MLESGERLAGYRIEGVLGSGGMGVVYEATQLSLQRTVALKLLAPHLSEDEAFRERFRREATLQAALEHPHIVTVYEAGESEEGLFIATRLVRGTNLKRLIDAGLAVGRGLRILEQVASALDAAHRAGLVHRDVKPQNILVDEHDVAYLADFGLIRDVREPGPTRAGEYLGSLHYVSPEQIRGEPVTPGSDLYAFGAVLYECLSGEVPFPRDTEAALLYAHLSEPPPHLSERRAELPAALDAVIERGLAKDPSERYSTAADLVEAAQQAVEATAEALAAAVPLTSELGPRPSGETVVERGLLRRAPVVEVEPERRISRELVLGGAIAVLGLLLLGFLVGRLARSEPEFAPTGVAVGGPLALSFPSDDWRPQTPPDVAGLALADPVGLASVDREESAALAAGMGRQARGPRLLPVGFVALLERTPRREAVRLGAHEGFRYRQLRHRRVDGLLNVYAVPTTDGVATIVCIAPPRAARGAFVRCEAVATTLVLRGVEAIPLGPDRRYATALNTALVGLREQREAGRRALREAQTPVAQARAAEQLAGSYRATATALEQSSPGPAEQGVHRSITAALGRSADGYEALAAAARGGRRLEYDRAAAQVRRAEGALDSATRALARLGYKLAS